MYKDLILSQRPMFFIAPDDYSGSTQADLSGFSNFTYTDIDRKSILPGGRVTSAQLTVDNTEYMIGSNESQVREFSFDIWTDWWNSPTNIISSDNIYVYIFNEYVYFQVAINYELASNEFFTCWAPMTNFNEPVHIVANFTRENISLIVNGFEGEPVALPSSFDWPTSNSNINVGLNTASFAIFNRPTSVEEALLRYIQAKDAQPYSVVCGDDGGDFWDLTTNTSPVAGEIVLDSQDWLLGNFHNITIDRYGRLTLIQPPPVQSYTKAGVSERFITRNSNRIVLGTDHTASIPVSGMLSGSNGVIALSMDRDASTAQIIWTLYNKKSGEALTLETTSGNAVNLVKKTIDKSGSVSSTTIVYDDTIGTTNTIVTWFMGDYIKLHTGGGSTDINQVSGQDSVYMPFTINEETLLILGGYYDYSGNGIPFLDNLYLYNYTPTVSNYDTDFFNQDAATAYYLFSSGDGAGRRRGSWTLRTSVPFSGAYAATFVDWSGSPQLDFNDIYVSYNSSAYTAVTNRGYPIPNVPYSATMGDGSTPLGPIDIKITLASYRITGEPFLENLRLVFLSSATTKSTTSDKFATYPNVSGIMNQKSIDPWQFGPYSNYAFTGNGKITFPSDSYQTIEGCFTASTDDNCELICFNNGTERNVTMNAGSITQTGFSKVVVNGVTLSGSMSVVFNEPLHIIAITSSPVTAAFSVGHTDGASAGPTRGVKAIAGYSTALDDATIAEHYAASRGLIRYAPSEIDDIGMTDDSVEPYLYALAWETTGATT
jgi:hypothetical protein